MRIQYPKLSKLDRMYVVVYYDEKTKTKQFLYSDPRRNFPAYMTAYIQSVFMKIAY